MSESAYKELLWHLLLRGHDTFFLWCMADELASEIRLVHEVCAAAARSLRPRGWLIHPYRGFLERGEPVCFDVPQEPSTIISGLQLGDQVLVRRTEFESQSNSPSTRTIQLAQNSSQQIEVPAAAGNHVVATNTQTPLQLTMKRGSETLYSIGWYEIQNRKEE